MLKSITSPPMLQYNDPLMNNPRFSLLKDSQCFRWNDDLSKVHCAICNNPKKTYMRASFYDHVNRQHGRILYRDNLDGRIIKDDEARFIASQSIVGQNMILAQYSSPVSTRPSSSSHSSGISSISSPISPILGTTSLGISTPVAPTNQSFAQSLQSQIFDIVKSAVNSTIEERKIAKTTIPPKVKLPADVSLFY
jgi:hypothetical protein